GEKAISGKRQSPEWGCSDLLNSVIPTGADHRKAMICGGEGSCVSWDEERIEIESEQTTREHERAAGTLCPAAVLPHSSQETGLCEGVLTSHTYSGEPSQSVLMPWD